MQTAKVYQKGSFKLFDSIRQQLRMNHAQYAKALGLSSNATSKYTRDKQVPKVVELAAQSLLREPLQAPKLQDPNPETYLLQIAGNVPKVTRVLGVEVVNFLGKEYTLLELPVEKRQDAMQALAEEGQRLEKPMTELPRSPKKTNVDKWLAERDAPPAARTRRKPQVKKQAVKVRSGRGGARPGSGRKPVIAGSTQHERVMDSVVKLLEKRGASRTIDLFEAFESTGSDEFGIRTNTPRKTRVDRFRAVIQHELSRSDSRIFKLSPGVVAPTSN